MDTESVPTDQNNLITTLFDPTLLLLSVREKIKQSKKTRPEKYGTFETNSLTSKSIYDWNIWYH